jgi:hypothetical protein
MSFKISPASHLDAEEIAQLIIVTNGTDRFFGLITPPERNATPEQKAAHLRWRAERIGMNIQRKGTHFFTAVDVASNKIVALAGVTAPENEKSAHSGEISETVDEALYKKFMEAVEQKNQELFGDRKNIWRECYVTSLMAWLPLPYLADRKQISTPWLSIRNINTAVLVVNCSTRLVCWQTKLIRSFTWNRRRRGRDST